MPVRSSLHCVTHGLVRTAFILVGLWLSFQQRTVHAQDGGLRPDTSVLVRWLNVPTNHRVDVYETAWRKTHELALGMWFLARTPLHDDRLFSHVRKIYSLGLGGHVFQAMGDKEPTYHEEVVCFYYGPRRWRQLQDQVFREGTPERLARLIESSRAALVQVDIGVRVMSPGIPAHESVSVPEAARAVLVNYAVSGYRKQVIEYANSLYGGDVRSLSQSRPSARHEPCDGKEFYGQELLMCLLEAQCERFQLLPKELVQSLLRKRDEWLDLGWDIAPTVEPNEWFQLYRAVETNDIRMVSTVRILMTMKDSRGRPLLTNDPALWKSVTETVADLEVRDEAILQQLLAVASYRPTGPFTNEIRATAYDTLGHLDGATTKRDDALRILFFSRNTTLRANAAFYLACRGDEKQRKKGRNALEDIVTNSGVRKEKATGWPDAAKAIQLLGELGVANPEARLWATRILQRILERRKNAASPGARVALIEFARLAPEDALPFITEHLDSPVAADRIAGAAATRELKQRWRIRLLPTLRRAMWNGSGLWGFRARIEAMKTIASLGSEAEVLLPELRSLFLQEGYGPVGNASVLASEVIEKARGSQEVR